MRYIENFEDGMHVRDIYLCKAKNVAVTRNGREYVNVTLQDRTGLVDAKIWDPDSPGIEDFKPMDYIAVDGNVTIFNGAKQVNITRLKVASEGQYDQSNYFPITEKSIPDMQKKLAEIINGVGDPYLSRLLKSFFSDADFVKRFSQHSAARAVHHGFIGGLLEHSLSVAELCVFFGDHYHYLNKDLLVTGAILHDIGKLRELSAFPSNEYTDDGQLLGHIMIGAQMVSERIGTIEGFPKRLKNDLIHMILSHHGELEFGSPKKPSIPEALVLSLADNLDAKAETIYEALRSKEPVNPDGWVGFNKFLETNIRKS